MKSRKDNKKYPLDHKPLRNPGESAQEERTRILEDEIYAPLLMAFGIIAVAVGEWVQVLTKKPLTPWISTFGAVIVIGYFIFQFFNYRERLRNLELGIEGEKYVGQFLEDLRSKGYKVYHDIPGDRFNIDHLVVSPQGLFVIETKTRMKPGRGSPKIEVRDDAILVNGFIPDRDPISQALASVRWIRNLLEESTGHKYRVGSAILFPGWWVEGKKITRPEGEVWVLNPKGLDAFIEQEAVHLSTEDMALVSSRIKDHIIASI